ncbi:hypothetical protein JK636_23505 [Clostridium sp. YIM B02515]|uniref:Uncharacterized protein n=1 Tax=Clostridium rhizosphaerae TaxID=2803861 RepID=A0ABS1TJD8_9CLOT|nr:hypothetical protein [Clostridium rhizosphaerae]MBL4938676.1 hypothetical protein [Clostridium rhizosphaerae]
MDDKTKTAGEHKTNIKGKHKMSFTRFSNLLYEASSSLVPGTGELYNTQYTGDDVAETAETLEENKKG